jgi:hypothetical protein
MGNWRSRRLRPSIARDKCRISQSACKDGERLMERPRGSFAPTAARFPASVPGRSCGRSILLARRVARLLFRGYPYRHLSCPLSSPSNAPCPLHCILPHDNPHKEPALTLARRTYSVSLCAALIVTTIALRLARAKLCLHGAQSSACNHSPARFSAK